MITNFNGDFKDYYLKFQSTYSKPNPFLGEHYGKRQTNNRFTMLSIEPIFMGKYSSGIEIVLTRLKQIQRLKRITANL